MALRSLLRGGVRTIALARRAHFDDHESMHVEAADAGVSEVAAAIAEPARTRMLYCLMDGHARTSTELASVAEVSASTASVHLARLHKQGLVSVRAQGRHRYYSLASARVAAALEALTVVAGGPRVAFAPGTPPRLRVARTCYDHMAGGVAVALHDQFLARGWMVSNAAEEGTYALTSTGAAAFAALGVDLQAVGASRRRFAYACLDWSERRPHLAGGLGAAVLAIALQRNWVVRALDCRALSLTRSGRLALRSRFGLELQA